MDGLAHGRGNFRCRPTDRVHKYTSQALILTHELSPQEHFDDYLVRKLEPLQPLLMVGRSARAAPPCSKPFSVYDGWKDSLFSGVA